MCIRDSFRSVPMQELLNEAKRLASEGVKELVLVAQETTPVSYTHLYNIEVRDAYSAFVFSGRTHRGGGYLGALICSILYKELGGAGSVLVVLLISVISLILVTEKSLLSFLKKAVDFFTVEGYEEDIEERLAKKKRKAKRCV